MMTMRVSRLASAGELLRVATVKAAITRTHVGCDAISANATGSDLDFRTRRESTTEEPQPFIGLATK